MRPGLSDRSGYNNTSKSLRDFDGPLSRLLISPWAREGLRRKSRGGSRNWSGKPVFLRSKKRAMNLQKKINLFVPAATRDPGILSLKKIFQNQENLR
jgi:hypothetical protein